MTHVPGLELEIAPLPDVDDGRWYVVVTVIAADGHRAAHVYGPDELVDLVNALVVAGMQATERNRERPRVGDDLSAIAAGLGDGL